MKTPDIFEAIIQGDVTDVLKYISSDGDLTVTNAKGRQPIHEAAIDGNVKILRELLSSGADIEAKDTNGFTPIFAATVSNTASTINFLAKNRANIDYAHENSKHTALHLAMFLNHNRAARALISAGANVNVCDKMKKTPLHFAMSEYIHEKTIRDIIAAGADIDAPDAMWETPLHWSASLERARPSEILIKAGADINASDVKGKTPLHQAVISECTKSRVRIIGTKKAALLLKHMIRCLYECEVQDALFPKEGFPKEGKISEGIYVELLNESISNSPELQRPKRRQVKTKIDIIEMLLNGGSKIDAMDKQEHTPLYYAIKYCNEDIASLLIAAGASIDFMRSQTEYHGFTRG